MPKANGRTADGPALPHSLPAERSTLGAALLQASAADYVIDHLTCDAYFRHAHQLIFLAMRDLRQHGVDVDVLTLQTALTRTKQLETVGGPVYLAGLCDGMPRSSNVESYAGILKDLAAKRALMAFATQTLEAVTGGEQNAEMLLADADRRLVELQAGHVNGRLRSLRETAPALREDLEWRVANRGTLTGVETGFASINDLTLGWQPTDLIIIAAQAVHREDEPCDELCGGGGAIPPAGWDTAARGHVLVGDAATAARISHAGEFIERAPRAYPERPFHRRDWGVVSQAMQMMDALAIAIDDRAGQTAWEIRSACRRLKAEEGLDLVIVDYVQLMAGTLDRRSANRNDEVTDISRRLKALADEVSCPVLLLSQLSRAGEKRTDKRPQLSDLRESGSLEQDSESRDFPAPEPSSRQWADVFHSGETSERVNGSAASVAGFGYRDVSGLRAGGTGAAATAQLDRTGRDGVDSDRMTDLKIHFTDAQAAALKRLSAEREVSVTELVRRAVDAYLKRNAQDI